MHTCRWLTVLPDGVAVEFREAGVKDKCQGEGLDLVPLTSLGRQRLLSSHLDL